MSLPHHCLHLFPKGSPDLQHMVPSCFHGLACILTLSSMYSHETHTLKGAHRARINWLQFSQKARKLVSADEKGVAVVWDADSGILLSKLNFKESISVVA